MAAIATYNEGQIIHDDFALYRDASDWVPDRVYAINTYVSYKNKTWLCIGVPLAGEFPDSSPNWQFDYGLVDASAITVGLIIPSGSIFVYSLISPGTPLIHDATGRYHVEWDTTGNPGSWTQGTNGWQWVWYPVGTGQTQLTAMANVKASPVPLPMTPSAPVSVGQVRIIEQVITAGMIAANVPITVACPFIPSAAIGSIYQGMGVNNLITVTGGASVSIAMSDGVNATPFVANDIVVLTVVQ